MRAAYSTGKDMGQAILGMATDPAGCVLKGLEEVPRGSGNVLGRYCNEHMTIIGRTVEMMVRRLVLRRMARTVLSLSLFEMRQGRLPEGFDELVTAGILDAIPVDPFCDKPLRYSRERRRVWSVGPDESDDGGRDEPAKWTERDYVLAVPGAAAP